MEYHNIHGGREECSSNESGWTMYIASPDHGYTHDEVEHDHDTDKHRHVHDNNAENNESDDSMISDASSGPSHQGFVYPGIEESHDFDESRANRKCTGKKQQRQVQKKPSNQDRKAAKEQPGSKVNSTSKYPDSKIKFRKNK